MWLRTFLLFLLVVFLLRAVSRLLRGVVQGATQGDARRQRAQPAPVKMIADPVCGTYVVPSKALQLARGRETLYFCSDKCREQWVNAH
jgi:YHS domain-containing protein